MSDLLRKIMTLIKFKHPSPVKSLEDMGFIVKLDEKMFMNFFGDKRDKHLISLDKIIELLEQKNTKEFFKLDQFAKLIEVFELFCGKQLYRYDPFSQKYSVHPLIFGLIVEFLKFNVKAFEKIPTSKLNTTCRPCCPNITKPHCDWC